MQGVLRTATRTPARLQPHSIQTPRRCYASTYNPLGWIREKLAPAVKERQSDAEVRAGRAQAAAEGTVSVFEKTAVPAASGKETRSPKAGETHPRPALGVQTRKEKPTHHQYSTANFKISHRKLNMLGRQISGKPIDYAILQMQFSEKRASTRILNMLATAKDHAARYKRLNEQRLVVAEAWVTKGPRRGKKIEPRGRGHHGVRVRSNAKMTVVLREGKTEAEKKAELRARRLRRIVSASLVRQDVPIRNPAPTWGW